MQTMNERISEDASSLIMSVQETVLLLSLLSKLQRQNSYVCLTKKPRHDEIEERS